MKWDDIKPGNNPTGVVKWDDLAPAQDAGGTSVPVTKPMSRVEKIMRGMGDPISAAAQMITNALPPDVVRAGNEFNNWLADKTGIPDRIPEGGINQMITDKERAYQAARAAAGESGIDAYRAAGNIATIAPIAASSPVGARLASRIGIGALTGTGYGALQPVVGAGETKLSDLVTGNKPVDYWNEKLKQMETGAVVGGLSPVFLAALSRVISPRASVNPQLQALRDEGVRPTIGQALGGKAAIAEEKLQSVPILGDMIHRARSQTLDTFNNAAINRALEPVGAKIEGVGQDAVKKAGDILSQQYDDALSQINGVKFDAKFDMDYMQLKQMANNLVPSMRNRFNRYANDILDSRMSQNGSMLADVYKSVDSEIGKAASTFGKSSVASEQELGDALSQLQNLLKQQMLRSNPNVAPMIDAADRGWANLVRIEQAAKAAKNTEGVFTPAQLNAAIQSADDSVRGRAVARGTALMQDIGSAAQKIIGSKYPDSGTAGRMALGGAAVGAGYINPVIPAALVTGGSIYTRPVQNAMVSALMNRPDAAPAVAHFVRRLSPYVTAFAEPTGNAFSNPGY